MVSARDGTPLSLFEFDKLLSKLREMTDEVQAEITTSLGLVPKKNQRSDALRTDSIALDSYGKIFWKLSSYDNNANIILQDVGNLDSVTPQDKWLVYDKEEEDMVAREIYCFCERNKIKIIDAGGLDPLLSFLQSTDKTLQEYSAAALLTLSTSPINKPTIISSNSAPRLIDCLKNGTPQAKIDIITALQNLSTPSNLPAILASAPIISLLRAIKKASKTAKRCMALLESMAAVEEGRDVVMSVEGGVLAIVEVLEEGSLLSKEHAVGALLTMCERDRAKYREVILREGSIPGLLELTMNGVCKARGKAWELLRNSRCARPEIEAEIAYCMILMWKLKTASGNKSFQAIKGKKPMDKK